MSTVLTIKNAKTKAERRAARTLNSIAASMLPPAGFVKAKTRRAKTAPKGTRRNTKKKGGPGGTRKGRTESSGKYALALRNPFSTSAMGCRLPDSYSMPTVTYHVRGAITCTSDATGAFSGIFLPSPCFTWIQGLGTNAGSRTAFTNNNTTYYVIAPSTLANVLTEYRVVSWGIRILPKDTVNASKGKWYVSTVPTTANAPSWNTLETVTAAGVDVISEYACGLSTSVLSNTVNLQSCRTFTAQDLMRGEIMVTGLPLNTSFYDFRGTTDRSSLAWNVGQVLADEGVFNNTTGLVNATAGGRKDIASLRGGMAVALFATGMPASTQEFDMEYVYHMEGTPNISGSGGGQIVPSAAAPLVGSTAVVEKILSAAHIAGSVVSMLPNPVGGIGQMVADFSRGAGTQLFRGIPR